MIVMDSINLLSMGRTDHSEISPPRRWPEEFWQMKMLAVHASTRLPPR